ncbi:uncharacterized protein LOC110228263 [Arabidopsis lyrata subsp. lyrata]|uniref:uncharacterized protein LOC110228263 n=1 Tax=Arabidopsis lyrata subsp. lyrata TaxID=81972 RepID=UPI000A29CEC3|nr:uncharacterized protein LOC110228263 [Arabidopsis lyrata subsp. lyrata]|eukprot:XP_020880701.1 uncharacterized protein LOC110228263 [Arabidopsis lyrata subsp. lyrata]
MAKTRGGGQVCARRSRRNQGLEVEDVAPATTLKVNKKVNKKKTTNKVARRRSSTRAKKVAAIDDEVEDVTPKVAAVDDEVEDVTPEAVEEEKGNDKDITPEADQTEKAMCEDENEGEGCLTGQGQEEDEEEVANIEEEACLTGQDQQEYHQEEAATMEVAANNEEVANMEEDGVGNGQDKKKDLQVVKVFNFNAPLWRPTADISVIGEAIHEKIAWPVLKIDVTATATPEPTLTKSVSPGSNSSTKSPKQKCVLLDCNNSGRIVAEGTVMSTDPEDKCHNVPLGPNASKVSVDLIKIGNAKVWRPNSEFVFISDAVGSVVPWPTEKVKFV